MLEVNMLFVILCYRERWGRDLTREVERKKNEWMDKTFVNRKKGGVQMKYNWSVRDDVM